MQPHAKKQRTTRSWLAFYGKCGAIVVLFLFSILMVACGGGANATQATLSDPPVTVTIDLGKQNGSPPPASKDYWCGAWAINTTPPLNAATQVGIYAKFTHNVNGNPEGVGGASAFATVTWPDGRTQGVQANNNAATTSDGLATFTIPTADLPPSYANRLTLVTVTFAKQGTPGCVVNAGRSAFFTLVVVSPTATPTPPDGGPPWQLTPPNKRRTPTIFPTSPFGTPPTG